MGWGVCVKPPLHFHCVLHAKRVGAWVQIVCTIAYILTERPQEACMTKPLPGATFIFVYIHTIYN